MPQCFPSAVNLLCRAVCVCLPPPAAAHRPPALPALPPRLPGSFSHCWEEQDAATAAGSKLSTSTSLKKKKKFTLTYTDATTSSDSHRLRPDGGSLLGITWQDIVEQKWIFKAFFSVFLSRLVWLNYFKTHKIFAKLSSTWLRPLCLIKTHLLEEQAHRTDRPV